MFDARPRRNPVMAAAITVALLGAAPSHAAEKPSEKPFWSYSLGAAVSTAYGYRVDEQAAGTYTTTFDPGLLLSATVDRTITRHTSLVVSAGYRGYSRDLGLIAVPEAPPVTGQLRAQYFSIGVGLRIEPRHGSGPYMQALPALFVSRWEESTVDHEGWNFMTGAWQSRSGHSDSFSRVLPGIELSAGFRTRFWSSLGTDIGLRLTSSADVGEHDLGRFSSGKFHGLDELALVGSITWSP
jgi:hypothetical protein